MKFGNIKYLLLLFLFQANVFSQDIGKDINVIAHLDKLSFNDSERIILDISLQNISNAKVQINIYDHIYTSFQPIIFDSEGKEAEMLVEYKLKNTDINKVVKDIKARVIELYPNETFTYKVNLKDIYKIEPFKDYNVKVIFYADIAGNIKVYSKDSIKFGVCYTNNTNKQIKKPVAVKDVSVTPAETVTLMLIAESDNNWTNFLKYIKLNKYINAYPDYVEVYNQADDYQKVKVLDDFENYLKKKREDYLLEFKVLEQSGSIEDGAAYVDVLIKRFGPKTNFNYKYRYKLEYDKRWLVTDIEVTLVKGL